MIFTSGNILTLCVSIILIIVFRQMDRNNRSIEKAKKFGDKLKDDLDGFIKERASRLEESSIALEVQQTKAVAAVKRLEEIRADIAGKEASLLERNKAVESFGKQIEAYDATIRQLMEMTSQAESNLTRITSESDFADNLGRKLLNSQRQLQEVSSAIPALRDEFAKENRAMLESVHAETVQRMTATIADLEKRIEAAHKGGATLVSDSSEKLKDIFNKAYAEAARRADGLEDAAFQKLKEQASERLRSYRESIEEKTSQLHEQTKGRLLEVQQMVKGFKGEWQAEANAFLESTRAETERLGAECESAIGKIEVRLSSAETASAGRLKELEADLARAGSELGAGLETLRNDVDFRMAKFEKMAGDVDRLDEQLRLAMQETEKRVNGEFSLFASDQEAKQSAFAEKLTEASGALSGRMETLEAGLNELKARAYENVSEKLKGFEDDFFADLAKRSESISSSIERWTASVGERLESLSSESESSRRDLETKYAAELKERLASIAEQYHQQTVHLEEQIASVEGELRSRITASDQSILSFVEQSRSEFAQARETASLHVQNELSAHALSVQDILRKQEREVEAKTREYLATIENARAESEATLASIKADLASWQSRNEQQLEDAKSLLDDRIASIGDSSKTAMADLEAAHQSEFRDFVADTAEERKQLRDSIDGMKGEIASARDSFQRRSAEALEEFRKMYEEMTSVTALRVREHAAETDQTIKSLKSMVQEMRESVDQTREKLFQKIQSDTANLGETLEEIDRKQKAFIAQTRVFDRAEELKTSLETNIESIKGEISRLDVYRDTMNTLEQQYGKVRKLEEEANQKVSRFMAEKKRIDILETDFNKLLGLSDSIDRKISELTLTNDDLQQYQVQIRRFEESIAEVNSRYERLEKKAVVLDQTAGGVDKAFEGLKELETSLSSYRSQIAGVPDELSGIRGDLATLLENKDKTSQMVERLSSLDTVLDDVEKRTEKMQTAREWLARTETRLEEISRQSEDQLKLLGDLLKDDGAAKKSKGAPPIGIRENVVKLAHQGWKVDEIARALHLSRGEVELILELPQK